MKKPNKQARRRTQQVGGVVCMIIGAGVIALSVGMLWNYLAVAVIAGGVFFIYGLVLFATGLSLSAMLENLMQW